MAVHAVDIAIVGGGPAGAATALSLKHTRPQLSVVIIEPSDFSAPRVGETLPPVAEPLLRQLGVLEAVTNTTHIPVYSTSAAWNRQHPVPNEYFGQLHTRGWHLDRNQFDQQLLATAKAAGAIHLLSKFRQAELMPDSTWQLRLQSNTQHSPEEHLRARFVVDASGRQALFAKQQGQRPAKIDQLIGSVRFFTRTTHAPTPDTGATLIEACEHGWWYSAFLPQGRLVVAVMTDADIARRLRIHQASAWIHLAKASPYTRQRIVTQCQPNQNAPMVRAAATQQLSQPISNNWLAVGDAASSVDPLTSQGITRALRFGLLGGYAICDWFANKKPGLAQYDAIVRAEFNDYLQRKQEVYCDEQRWPKAPFWTRRHQLE